MDNLSNDEKLLVVGAILSTNYNSSCDIYIKMVSRRYFRSPYTDIIFCGPIMKIHDSQFLETDETL